MENNKKFPASSRLGRRGDSLLLSRRAKQEDQRVLRQLSEFANLRPQDIIRSYPHQEEVQLPYRREESQSPSDIFSRQPPVYPDNRDLMGDIPAERDAMLDIAGPDESTIIPLAQAEQVNILAKRQNIAASNLNRNQLKTIAKNVNTLTDGNANDKDINDAVDGTTKQPGESDISYEQRIKEILNAPSQAQPSSLLAKAMVAFLPTIGGALFAGLEGAAAGADIGMEQLKQYQELEQDEIKRQQDQELFAKKALIDAEQFNEQQRQVTARQTAQLRQTKLDNYYNRQVNRFKILMQSENEQIKAKAKLMEKSLENQQEMSRLAVPYFKGHATSKEEQAKLGLLATQYKSAENSLGKMDKILDSASFAEYTRWGSEKNVMFKSYLSSLQLQLKEINNMGALAGPDKPMLDDIISKGFSMSNVKKQIQVVKQSLETSKQSIYENRTIEGSMAGMEKLERKEKKAQAIRNLAARSQSNGR